MVFVKRGWYYGDFLPDRSLGTPDEATIPKLDAVDDGYVHDGEWEAADIDSRPGNQCAVTLAWSFRKMFWS